MVEDSKKELYKLFDNLPKELRGVLLSEETADKIKEICQRYQIIEKDISEVAKLVGNILMGLLVPENFTKTLQVTLSLEQEKVQGIFREVNRFILFPVKSSLIQFYPDTKFMPGGSIMKETIEAEKINKEKTQTKIEQESGSDVYREIV